MISYTMTITEECNSNEDPSLLQLWENRDGRIWIQVGYDEMEPHGMHGIAITQDDAHGLIAELQRLLKGMEGHERAIIPSTVTPSKSGDKHAMNDDKGQQRASGAVVKQLTLTPEQPIQKVNWNK